MPDFAPPLIPDSDEAADWAREELSRGVYSTQPSLWDWLREKILGFISEIISRGGGWESAFLPLTVLAIIAGVIILAVTYRGPIRRRRAEARVPGGVWQTDDARSASELRAAARAAATAGNFSLAAIEQFRTVVRSLEERALLEATQGMTAVEVAHQIAGVFPASSPRLSASARTFDEALYGSRPAAEADYLTLVDLESHLRGARPEAVAGTK